MVAARLASGAYSSAGKCGRGPPRSPSEYWVLMDGGGLVPPFRSGDQILVGFWGLELGSVTSPWTPSLTLVLVLRWGDIQSGASVLPVSTQW